MKLAIIGYGKMGKTIEKIAIDRGHTIVATIDKDKIAEVKTLNNTEVHVAIEFTEPESAFSNLKSCIQNGIPIVSGTTGWLDKYEELSNYCIKQNGAFFYASNFSIGVNIFFKLNELLAKLMTPHNYGIQLEETHHTQKKDAPSGTAITLAQAIVQENKKYDNWALIEEVNNNQDILPIKSFRKDAVPGTHEITYHSDIDDISIKHTAHSRKGFAMGAVLAAEWLIDKKGIFSMADMLKL